MLTAITSECKGVWDSVEKMYILKSYSVSNVPKLCLSRPKLNQIEPNRTKVGRVSG